MPRTVNPIKKIKVKGSLKQGKSAREALREAGYSQGHINRSTANKIVKDSISEISKELKAKDITYDLVIKRLDEDRELARNKRDIATMKACDELLGKYIAMFTDKQEIKQTIEQPTNDDITRTREALNLLNKDRLS